MKYGYWHSYMRAKELRVACETVVGYSAAVPQPQNSLESVAPSGWLH